MVAKAPEGQWQEKPPRVWQGQPYQRFVVTTHLVRAGEPLVRTLAPYLEGRVAPGDVVAVGEKIVAVAEGRAVWMASVTPRPLARWLSRHVSQRGHGLGLGRPETMEMAIAEVGCVRIVLAAAVGALGRAIGRRGDFYRVAGRRVAAIDGPGPSTIAPYDRYIVLAPERPTQFAQALARRMGVGVAVVDINDVGGEVLGQSAGVDAALVRGLLSDNPMGQGSERTPVAVLRRAAGVTGPAADPPSRPAVVERASAV
jgi:hypothetical protein